MSDNEKKIVEHGICDDVFSLNYEHRKIAEWLRKLKFKKRLFGGVSERDVWKKIGELNAMYTSAVEAERVRYDTLLEEYKGSGIEEGSHTDRLGEGRDEA